VAAWVSSESLLPSGPGGCSPRRRLPQGASSRDRELRRRRRGRPGQPASHGVGRRCPAGGVQPSGVGRPGIRLSSHPVSDHLGSSSSGSGGRPSAVHPSSVQPSGVCPSVRTRPSPPASEGGRATVTTATGGGPVAAEPSTARLTVEEAGTRATLSTSGWSVGGRWRTRAAGLGGGRGGRACPLSDQAGQAGVRSARRGRRRCGHGCRLPREVAATGRVAAVLGWVRDHGAWSSPSLTAGWADPEGPLDAPAGIGVRPQRGPSRRRALPARCRQRSDLRRCWWACQDLNLGPHPYQQNARNRCAKRRSRRSCPTVEAEVMCSHRVQLCALILRPGLSSVELAIPSVRARLSTAAGN
jgi:hypothetical protein